MPLSEWVKRSKELSKEAEMGFFFGGAKGVELLFYTEGVRRFFGGNILKCL